MPMPSGKYLRKRGHDYERQSVSEFKSLGVECSTSRNSSYMLDARKIDIDFFGKLPLDIQCKCVNSFKNPIKILKEIDSAEGNYPIVFQKVVGDGDYVFMYRKDFMELLGMLIKEQIIYKNGNTRK